jgi:hypothetical protein
MTLGEKLVKLFNCAIYTCEIHRYFACKGHTYKLPFLGKLLSFSVCK